MRVRHTGGIYNSLPAGYFAGLPAEWLRGSSGGRWNGGGPQAGDTGTIVHIFPASDGAQHIYLLQFGKDYVPIGCNYLALPGEPVTEAETHAVYLSDSLRNAREANRCNFKLRNVNGQWARTGLTALDSLSENFACARRSAGADTVLLAKYIFDNGALPSEKAYVLWLEQGRGYAKAFYNNTAGKPTQSPVRPYPVAALLQPFFAGRLDTVTSVPKQEVMISHNMGYSIQVQAPRFFFRKRFQDMEVRQDPAHPLAAWWLLLAGEMKNLDAGPRKP
ncbi:MAG: hypothetical protein EOO11_18870 [Chitinophagaceae bacterium]|nr:MAG: hypothetical protein EOO11_18870 [Chitinophagaceae bacterium]